MSIALDIRVVHLLCSRICHDMAGPVGAVSNGLELAREMGDGIDGEALDLVDMSARQMFERLRFFRIAFGLAEGAIRTTAEARSLVTPAVLGERCSFQWDQDDSAPMDVGDKGLKLTLNMSLLAGETLPRGGGVAAKFERSGDQCTILLQAEGQGARIEDEVRRAMALECAADEVTPKSAPALLAGVLAQGLGGSIKADVGDDRVVLSATVAAEK